MLPVSMRDREAAFKLPMVSHRAAAEKSENGRHSPAYCGHGDFPRAEGTVRGPRQCFDRATPTAARPTMSAKNGSHHLFSLSCDRGMD
jgi:hypothetical protein